MARILLKLGRYEEALAALYLCKRKLGEPPVIALVKHACYQKDLGIAHMYLGHHQEALKNFEESQNFILGAKKQFKNAKDELQLVEEEIAKVLKAIQQSQESPRESSKPFLPSFNTKPMTETLYNELIRENHYREVTIYDAYNNKKRERNRRTENIASLLMVCIGVYALFDMNREKIKKSIG